MLQPPPAPKQGFARLRSEVGQLRDFLDGWRPALDSAHFAALLGRPMHASQLLLSALTPGERAVLLKALSAREAVLNALGKEYDYAPETRAPRARNPRHALFDPEERGAVRRPATLGHACLSKLVQWGFDKSTFNEPDFTDGLAGAVQAVLRSTSLHLSLDLQGLAQAKDPEFRDPLKGSELAAMADPRLLADLKNSLGPTMRAVASGGGLFHHEVELVGVPWVSHVTVVAGGNPPKTSSRAHASGLGGGGRGEAATTANHVLQGALVSLLTASDGAPPKAPAAQSGATGRDSALLASLVSAKAALEARGAMCYAVVNFETREFLACRHWPHGPTARWADASFLPWRPALRQWVFETPLVEGLAGGRAAADAPGRVSGALGGGGEAAGAHAPANSGAWWRPSSWIQARPAPPEWQLVDVDGALADNALWDTLLAAPEAREEEEPTVLASKSEEAPTRAHSRGIWK